MSSTKGAHPAQRRYPPELKERALGELAQVLDAQDGLAAEVDVLPEAAAPIAAAAEVHAAGGHVVLADEAAHLAEELDVVQARADDLHRRRRPQRVHARLAPHP